MIDIELVNEKNRDRILRIIKTDVIQHVFAVYDIQNDQEHTTTYAAFEGEKLKGYILIYTGTDIPSVVLECEEDVEEDLLKHAPADNFIIHTLVNLLPAIKKRSPAAEHYVEDWMLVKKESARFFESNQVRRLQTEQDASSLADMLLTRKDRPENTLKKYVEWISRMPMYGVFDGNELVSYAGSFIQLPQVWFIGGVYTDPNHRNRGYATMATSAVTQEALRKSEAAMLFVRTDNYPAIKAYEKIGYRKIGEKLWVDIGTGLKP